MSERSYERADQEDVPDRTEFYVADAQDLPLDDGLFDAVITELATALPADKALAVAEYPRVAKPGGCVVLNGSTWPKVPPPAGVVAWAGQDLGANVQPLAAAKRR